MTVPADLTGCRAKLARAQEHYEVLDREIGAWSDQHATGLSANIRREGSWQIFEVPPIPTMPIRHALISGDCIQNLRMALDHLVWQLVLREGKTPTRRNHFPILKDPQEWTETLVRLKHGPQRSPLYPIPIGGDGWTIIEDAQPFKAVDPKTPEGHPLAVLARLSNFDKHRTLHVQMPFPDPEAVRKCIGFAPATAVPLEIRLAPPGPIAPVGPTELVRYQFAAPQASLYVKNPIPIDPTFGEGEYEGAIQAPVTYFPRIGEAVETILEKVSKLPNVVG